MKEVKVGDWIKEISAGDIGQVTSIEGDFIWAKWEDNQILYLLDDKEYELANHVQTDLWKVLTKEK